MTKFSDARQALGGVRRGVERLLGGKRPTVAVLRLTGVITSQQGALRSGLNLAGLAGAIEAAFSARNVKAVALAINSPGGSPVQSALIHNRIRALADDKGIPVFAFAEDVAASGGYWLALAGDEVFADPNSIIGSIGVISAGFGFVDLLQKLGVERRLYTQGDHKSLLDPFLPENPADVDRLHEIQKDMFESFRALVKARRGDRLARRKDKVIFNGDVWTGARALQLGLIDGLGDLRTIMRERFGEKVRLKVYGVRQSWLRRRLSLAAVGPDQWINSAIAALEARAMWARHGL